MLFNIADKDFLLRSFIARRLLLFPHRVVTFLRDGRYIACNRFHVEGNQASDDDKT